MTVVSSGIMDMTIEYGEYAPAICETQADLSLPKYRNSVWDTQESGSDKTHYWTTNGAPDVNGLSYDGPGTWGTHTSGLSARKIKEGGSVDPNIEPLKSNLWYPPEVAHSMDDEFDGTIDSAWYNYSLVSAAYGTLSVGTVDPYDTTFTSGDAVRVNVNPDSRRSWLLAQPPYQRQMFIGKTITLPTNLLIVSRMKFSQYHGTLTQVGEDKTVGLMLLVDATGEPDILNRVALRLNAPDSGAVYGRFFYADGGATSFVSRTTDVDARGQALEYAAIHKIGTTYHGWLGTAAGNWIWMGSFTSSKTFGHVGFYVDGETNDRPGGAVLGIDFIRFYETDNFLF